MKHARPLVSDLVGIGALTIAALIVHGYHPAVEDAEIYLPGVLKQLAPHLFPHNAQFFESHARMSMFSWVMAGTVRLTHLPVDIVMLGWHVASIYLLLLACWKIAALSFPTRSAVWCGVGLIAALLTIPIAGTSLYVMDQYVTSRSLSTPGTMFVVSNLATANYWGVAMWMLVTAAVHPFMAAFAGLYAAIFILLRYRGQTAVWWAFPTGLFEPATPAYHKVLETRPLHLITNWRWYELLGAFAPIAILFGFSRIARARRWDTLDILCRASMAFAAIGCIAAVVIARPGRYEQLSELQPMRCYQLIYVLMFLFGGGFLAEVALKNRLWRWLVLFVPLSAGMWYAQRQLFAESAHLEWTRRTSPNAWVDAFNWIRDRTPTDAYFALDPNHMVLPGQDEHGFRAIAERSMLADAVKDSGAASMFPALAAAWVEQVEAASGWTRFTRDDFLRLKKRYGIDWIVVAQPGVAGLTCPYHNDRLVVCRVD